MAAGKHDYADVTLKAENGGTVQFSKIYIFNFLPIQRTNVRHHMQYNRMFHFLLRNSIKILQKFNNEPYH